MGRCRSADWFRHHYITIIDRRFKKLFNELKHALEALGRFDGGREQTSKHLLGIRNCVREPLQRGRTNVSTGTGGARRHFE